MTSGSGMSAEISVALILTCASVSPGGPLGYAVVNNSNVSIMTGASYAVDHWRNGRWTEVELGYAFRLGACRLPPGRRRELTGRIRDGTEPGHYRIRKQVRERLVRAGLSSPPMSDGEPFEISAEFWVDRP